MFARGLILLNPVLAGHIVLVLFAAFLLQLLLSAFFGLSYTHINYNHFLIICQELFYKHLSTSISARGRGCGKQRNGLAAERRFPIAGQKADFFVK